MRMSRSKKVRCGRLKRRRPPKAEGRAFGGVPPRRYAHDRAKEDYEIVRQRGVPSFSFSLSPRRTWVVPRSGSYRELGWWLLGTGCWCLSAKEPKIFAGDTAISLGARDAREQGTEALQSPREIAARVLAERLAPGHKGTTDSPRSLLPKNTYQTEYFFRANPGNT